MCYLFKFYIFLDLISIIWSFYMYFCHILGHFTSLQVAGIFTIPRYLHIQVFDELLAWTTSHYKEHISQTSDHSFSSSEPTWIFHHPFTGQSTLAGGSTREVIPIPCCQFVTLFVKDPSMFCLAISVEQNIFDFCCCLFCWVLFVSNKKPRSNSNTIDDMKMNH